MEHDRFGWKGVRPYLITLLISSLIVAQWFRAGTFIATGDMGPFIRRGWAPEALWSWNHAVTGAGSATYTIGRGIEFVVIDFVHLLGGSEYEAQWLWYTGIYGFAAVAAAYAAAAFVRYEPAVVVAGSFAVLNGFFLTRLPNPLNIVSVATCAAVTGMAMRVASGKRIPAPWAGLVVMPTSLLTFNPPMFLVAYAWALGGTTVMALVVLGRSAAWRLVKWFPLAALFIGIMNLWWMVPFAQSMLGGGGAQTTEGLNDPTAWLWAQVNNTIPNVATLMANWAWNRPQYLPFASSMDDPAWQILRYATPALVLLSPLIAVRSRRRLTLGLIAFSCVFIFLAKGLVPPFEAANLWLYDNVPGFWLFREPMSKLGQLLVVFYAIAFACIVEGVALRAVGGWWKQPLRQLVAGTVVLVAIAGVLVHPYPLYTGAVIPDLRPNQPSAHVRVPDFWITTANRINADPRPGKVLILPLDDYYQMPTTWGYSGVDSIANLLIQHPVVQRKPDGYFGDVAGFSAVVQSVETALLTGDLKPVPRLLDVLGVGRVIVRNDLVRGLPGRTYADGRDLTKAMSRVEGVTLESSGPLDVYAFEGGTNPTVRTYDNVLAGTDRPEATASAIGSSGAATAVLQAPPDPSGTDPAVVDRRLKSTDDVVDWPVPAVDAGSPTATFVLKQPGTFNLGVRSIAPPVYSAAHSAAAGEVVLIDPTRVTVDGRTQPGRPAIRIPVPGVRPLALSAGERTVSLDDWTDGTRAATFPIGASTDVQVLAATDAQPKVSGYSRAYDCNNYEPRPVESLGLQRELLPGQSGVRLSALDHAACSAVTAAKVVPGTTYRIRAEYRHVKGQRPAICIVQDATDECELAPRLKATGRWTRFEDFVTAKSSTRSIAVLLYANAGTRFSGGSISEYRNVSIEALNSVARSTLWPGQVPDSPIELSAGTHTISVVGGLHGSVLEGFEPLEDCFRNDPLTPEEAGLFAEKLPGDPAAPSFRLGARVHRACLGSAVRDFGSASMYEISMQAARLNNRDPQICLYSRGPDACAKLPKRSVWGEGLKPYSALVQPMKGAVQTRLYLVGLRDLAGEEISQVEYRNVKMRPVAAPVRIVLTRNRAIPMGSADANGPERGDLDYSAESPAKYIVRTRPAPGQLLVLKETSAPGWAANGASGAERVQANGYANGWLMPGGAATGSTARQSTTATAGASDAPGRSVEIVYGPASVARAALWASPPLILLSLCWLVVARRRWRRASEEPGDE